ncbi:hypothetical protein VQ02_28910 [Methylobacterium variabile]|jgi:hypothetical protein|uniref:Uncharacterized protein n=1 Tax=Methylobacterium variabile TaxID=298794 RepID=A0A0J6S410_9HYPH|nr:hypothetical protein [Methylobacterium variabile]KMO29930.1 hypothetical protein VQ02_28910 [Methylobacterium variabile]
MPVDVEVDLYSGRPNPRFPLSPAAAAELERRLDALPPAAAGAATRDGLGYRGLRVAPGGRFADVFVSAGVVELRDRAGRTLSRADPGRRLERWLIEDGAGHLPADEARMLRDDLAR